VQREACGSFSSRVLSEAVVVVVVVVAVLVVVVVAELILLFGVLRIL